MDSYLSGYRCGVSDEQARAINIILEMCPITFKIVSISKPGLGYTVDELVGTNAFKFIKKTSFHKVKWKLALAVITGAAVDYTLEVICKDRSVSIWYSKIQLQGKLVRIESGPFNA